MSPNSEVKDAGKLMVNSTAEHSERIYYLRMISFCSDTSHGFFPYNSSIILCC